MKKCLKTFNDYSLSNKIFNMALILVISIGYIFLISVIFKAIAINYYLIIPMLVFLTAVSFFCTEGENKNIYKYMIFYCIFLIIFFLLPLLSNYEYFTSLFSYTVCMLPAILLTTEAIKYEGLTSFYLRIKDLYNVRKEINRKKNQTKYLGYKDNLNKYEQELQIEKSKLLESLKEDYDKEKILLKSLHEDKKREYEELLNKENKIKNEINKIDKKMHKKITGFEKYHLSCVKKDIEKNIEPLKEQIIKKEKEINDILDNDKILDNMFSTEKLQICSDYQIRYDKMSTTLEKYLQKNNTEVKVLEGEN